jgi:folate-binding protein YgfZ
MKNNYYSLDHYEFVRISGADTISFLQGQLSCNTELLSETQSLAGVLCNLKGRVIADFHIIKQGNDCLLQCQQGMAQSIINTLAKYAVFSKVEISLLNADSTQPGTDISAIGLIDQQIDKLAQTVGVKLPTDDNGMVQSADFSIIRLPGQRIEIWFNGVSAREQLLSELDLLESKELEAWHRADISSGIIHVTPISSEEYTPQLLNYDISGLIDFTKGCYTGQEVVARMYYRGTAKKRLYLANSSHTISADSQVLITSDGTGKDGGSEILAYSNSDDDTPLLLVILPTEVVESAAPLRLSNHADSVVNIQKLPYL